MAGIAENLSNPVTAQRTMGVDLNKEVSDRVKTYRSNPKKLQERYQMSQELLDLLALQQIKSEQSAIANDMKLKQAAMNPEASMTTKEKLTQNVVGTKTQEMASQIGGAYANMNKKRKAAMSKFATNAARRPAGIAAAMPKPVNKNQGLGALQGTTLAAKSGGIMPKFKVGTYVPTAEEVQEYIRNQMNMVPGTTPMTREAAEQALVDKYNAEQARLRQTVTAEKMEDKTLERPLSTDYSEAVTDQIIGEDKTKNILGEGGVGTFLKDQMKRDEDAFRKNYMAEAQKYLGMSPREQKLMAGERDRITKDLADYQAETKRLYSPEAEAERRRTTALRGLTLGGLGGVSQALQRLDSKEGTSRAARGAVKRGLSKEIFNLNNQAVRDAMGIRKEVFQAGADRYQQEVTRKFQTAGLQIGLNKEVLGQVNNNAKLFITANWKTIDADLANAATNFKTLVEIGLKNVDNKLKADIVNQTFQATLMQIDANKELKRELNRSNDFATLSTLRTNAESKTAANIARLEKVMGETVSSLEIAASAIDDSDIERKAEAITNKKLYEKEALRYMNELKRENDALLTQIDVKLRSLMGGGSGGFTLLP